MKGGDENAGDVMFHLTQYTTSSNTCEIDYQRSSAALL